MLMSMHHRAWRSWSGDRHGTISIMAVGMGGCLVCAGLAIDVGSAFVIKRQAQGTADLAALAAAGKLDRASEVAAATLASNGLGAAASFVLTKGRYSADARVSAAARFVAGATPYNAVRIDLTAPVPLYFAKSFVTRPWTARVSATAAVAQDATFSIGSRLISVRGGLPNALLGALLGGSVNLSAMDYRALVDAKIGLKPFMKALGAEIGVTGGTYRDVLSAGASVDDVLAAATTVARAGGDSSAEAALALLGRQIANGGTRLALDRMINLGSLANASVGSDAGSTTGIGATLSALDIVRAAAVAANGEHQVAVDLGAAVPGVFSVKLDLAIGEPAQLSPPVAVGQPGAIVRTAQTRLKLVAEIGGSGLLAGARIRLPIYIEVAYAEARLAAVSCPYNGREPSVTIAARPGILRAYIGEVQTSALDRWSSDPLVGRANIVSVPLVSIRGSARVAAESTREDDLVFTKSEIRDGVVKTTETSGALESLVSSLLSDLELQASIAGLPLSTSAVNGLVAATLANAAVPLDTLVSQVLAALGVHLGEADVQVHGYSCRGSVLAG